jgi:hypothetical protein
MIRFKRIKAALILAALRAVLLTFSVAAALVLGEAAARFAFFTSTEREEGAEKLWQSYSNAYLRPADDQGCSFSDSLLPHPFLGYVHSDKGPCGLGRVNNRGLMSWYDVPAKRDPDHFSILVIGGSVASHLAYGRWDGKSIWLETDLNRRYRSPNGKPFRVISGAAGGWAMPNQLVAAGLYAGFVDALVEIDGYNEAIPAGGGSALDAPNVNTFIMAAQPIGALRTVGATRLLQMLRRKCIRWKATRNSFLAYSVWRRLIAFVPSDADSIGGDSIGKFFALPSEWDREERDRWNRLRYEGYVREIAAIARANAIPYAQFLQPMPLLSKPLTPEESAHEQFVSAQTYDQIFVRAVGDLARERIHSASLVDVFQGHRETLYADHIHCLFRPDGGNPGYEIMSDRIARDLGEMWGLRPR